MVIFLGMAMIAGGAWTEAYAVDQPAWIGRALVVAGAIILLLGVNAALRRAGGQRMDRGGGLWWLGMTVLISCVALMGLVYVTLVTDFGAIQKDLVRGLLVALAVSETIRRLLFGFRRARG